MRPSDIISSDASPFSSNLQLSLEYVTSAIVASFCLKYHQFYQILEIVLTNLFFLKFFPLSLHFHFSPDINIYSAYLLKILERGRHSQNRAWYHWVTIRILIDESSVSAALMLPFVAPPDTITRVMTGVHQFWYRCTFLVENIYFHILGI